MAVEYGEDKLVITKRAAYLYLPHGVASRKLSNNFLEKKLGVAATLRNFNTITKLVELSSKS